MLPIIRVPSCLLTPAKVRLVPARPHELAHSQHTTPNPHQPSPPHPAPPKIKILLTHSSLSIPPCISLFPSPLLSSSSLRLPYLTPSHYSLSSLSSSLSFPLTPSPSLFCQLTPPPLPTPTNFLTYPEPVPPSLPRSIEIGKTLQRQALPERTGTVDIMAWHLLVTGSARPGWGWVEYITVVIIKRRRKVNLCGTLE